MMVLVLRLSTDAHHTHGRHDNRNVYGHNDGDGDGGHVGDSGGDDDDAHAHTAPDARAEQLAFSRRPRPVLTNSQ